MYQNISLWAPLSNLRHSLTVRLYRAALLKATVVSLCTACALTGVPHNAYAQDSRESEAQMPGAFLPTWKLLNEQEKQLFVSGYLRAWGDSMAVMDALIDYAQENPDEAVKGLEKIRALYEMKTITPEQLVRALNDFYADPDQSSAPLSQAVSAARGSLR